jgi:hypothetical protein
MKIGDDINNLVAHVAYAVEKDWLNKYKNKHSKCLFFISFYIKSYASFVSIITFSFMLTGHLKIEA